MFKFAAVMLGAAALMAPAAAHAGTTLQASGAPGEPTLASASPNSWAATSRHAGPWQAAGTLLGRATGAPEIAPGSTGYRYTLVTPMTLAAGETFAADRASSGDGELSAVAASGLAMAVDNVFGAASADVGSRFPLLDTVSATDGGQVSAKFTFRSIASRLPEPATWILMILGFGAIGGLMRYHIRRSEARFTAKLRRIAAGEDA